MAPRACLATPGLSGLRARTACTQSTWASSAPPLAGERARLRTKSSTGSSTLQVPAARKGHTRAHKGTQGHTRAHKSTQGHTRAHKGQTRAHKGQTRAQRANKCIRVHTLACRPGDDDPPPPHHPYVHTYTRTHACTTCSHVHRRTETYRDEYTRIHTHTRTHAHTHTRSHTCTNCPHVHTPGWSVAHGPRLRAGRVETPSTPLGYPGCWRGRLGRWRPTPVLDHCWRGCLTVTNCGYRGEKCDGVAPKAW
jgi:hypothetical protein